MNAYQSSSATSTVEAFFKPIGEFNSTFFEGEKSVVATAADVFTGEIASASLADDDLANESFLTVLNFNA